MRRFLFLTGVGAGALVAAVFWIAPAHAGTAEEFRGWGWSEHVGWISWNCVNTGGCEVSDYGLKFSGSDISGYIWSENVGWICFGTTCADTSPDGNPSYARLTEASGEVHGWARILGIAGKGWISLNCADMPGDVCNNFSNYKMTINRATGEVRGWLWNGNEDGTGIGWVTVNCADQGVCGQSNYFVTINTTETDCKNNIDDDYDGAIDCADSPDCDGKIGQDPDKVCAVEQLPLCHDFFDNDRNGKTDCADAKCRATDPTCPQNETGFCTNGIDDDFDGLFDCEDHPDCDEDAECKKPESICDDNRDNNGNGFTDCEDASCADACAMGKCAPGGDPCLRDEHCPAGGSCALQPFDFLETKNGSLFTSGGFDADRFPPVGKFNASMCLLSVGNSITNFRSDPAYACIPPPMPPARAFPARSNGYVTGLGSLDYHGIIADAYGTVTKITQGSDIPALLGNGIYYAPGSLDIDESHTFQNGIGGDSGAGLIVVDGDLTINQDLAYASSQIGKIKNLASVGWLVRGDVRVASSVKQIVGTFYIEGTFHSGSGGQPLDIFGSIVADEFVWQRSYQDLTRGSEVISEDGRGMANPPPGFGDAFLRLPRFQSIAAP